MKRLVSMLVVSGLVLAVGTPAFAQNAPSTAAAMRAQAAEMATQSVPSGMSGSNPSGRAVMWTGAGVFVTGLGVAVYGFLNNQNGEYPGFGEADATDSKLGAAGISVAFAGGALMAIGHRMSRYAPDVQVGVDRFGVSKKVSW